MKINGMISKLAIENKNEERHCLKILVNRRIQFMDLKKYSQIL